jgi:undecaprenyl diphosphate synthase
MDGNRRAARNEGVQAIKGHEKGFDALKGVSPATA